MPALRALRRRFPGARLTLGAHAGAARLLQRAGEVDRGLGFDHAELGWVFGARPKPPSPPGLVVAWMADPGGAIGARIAGCGVGQALVAPSRPDESGDVHCARFLLSSLAPLGVDAALDDRPLRVRSARRRDEVLVHPGSGSVRKNWPPDRFAAVCWILFERGAAVTLIAGEADVEAARAVTALLDSPVEMVREPPLEDLAARLAGCRAYLGNDSGVSHLAGLVGARTLALFGPTSSAVWAPLGPRVRVRDFSAVPAQVAEDLLQ